MRKLWFVLCLSGGVLLAQDSSPAKPTQQNSKASKGEVTVQGCVGRSSGDYVLTRQNPAMTYELQATGKTRLRNYLGQRVEVIGKESATLSTSSDALNKTGRICGDVDDHLHPDHREGMHGTPRLRAVGFLHGSLQFGSMRQSQSGGMAMISEFESQGGFFLAGSSSEG